MRLHGLLALGRNETITHTEPVTLAIALQNTSRLGGHLHTVLFARAVVRGIARKYMQWSRP